MKIAKEILGTAQQGQNVLMMFVSVFKLHQAVICVSYHPVMNLPFPMTSRAKTQQSMLISKAVKQLRCFTSEI